MYLHVILHCFWTDIAPCPSEQSQKAISTTSIAVHYLCAELARKNLAHQNAVCAVHCLQLRTAVDLLCWGLALKHCHWFSQYTPVRMEFLSLSALPTGDSLTRGFSCTGLSATRLCCVASAALLPFALCSKSRLKWWYCQVTTALLISDQ